MHNHRKKLLGITGNIACGKSTVVEVLRGYGAHTIDADRKIHEILKKGAPAYDPVLDEFGPAILGPDGEIDRRALGRIVFSDPAKLRRLEEIEHPVVRRTIEQEIAAAPAGVVVLDAVRLIEAGWAEKCDAVWVVVCRQQQQIERLVSTRGYSIQEATARMKAQGDPELKVRQASFVIDNSGSLRATEEQVASAWSAFAGTGH